MSDISLATNDPKVKLPEAAQSTSSQELTLESLRGSAVRELALQGIDGELFDRAVLLFDRFSGIAGQEYFPTLYRSTIDNVPLILSSDKNGEPLLKHLEDLSSSETLSSILSPDRAGLVLDLIENVIQPTSISQGDKATCLPTALEYLLAEKAPAEYARLVCELATEQVTEIHNKQLAISDQHLKEIVECEDPTDKGIASKIFQTAIMERANGAGFEYNYQLDGEVGDVGVLASGGITLADTPRIISDLLGEEYGALVIGNKKFLKLAKEAQRTGDLSEVERYRVEEQMKVVSTQLEEDGFSIVTLDIDESKYSLPQHPYSRHVVVVTNIEAGQVHFFEPSHSEGIFDLSAKDKFLRSLEIEEFPIAGVYVKQNNPYNWLSFSTEQLMELD